MPQETTQRLNHAINSSQVLVTMLWEPSHGTNVHSSDSQFLAPGNTSRGAGGAYPSAPCFVIGKGLIDRHYSALRRRPHRLSAQLSRAAPRFCLFADAPQFAYHHF